MVWRKGHDFVGQQTKLFLLLKNQGHDYGVEGHQSYGLATSLRVLLAQLEEIVERISLAFP